MLHARPNMNGNSAVTFREHARSINQAAMDLEYALKQASEIVHGRNYQGYQKIGQSGSLRDEDVARLQALVTATKAAQEFAVEMFQNGSE